MGLVLCFVALILLVLCTPTIAGQQQEQVLLEADQEIVIPLVFHIVSGTEANSKVGRLSQERILAQVAHLNSAFAGLQQPNNAGKDSKIRFVLQGIETYENNQWYFGCGSESNERAMKYATSFFPQYAVNIWTCKLELPFRNGTVAADVFGRVSKFPEEAAEDDLEHGIVLNYRVLTQPKSFDGVQSFSIARQGDTLVHELGHVLGLIHTFSGGCEAQGGGGDGVGDTPAQLIPANGLVCSSSSTNKKKKKKKPRQVFSQDSCPNLPGLDPVNNFMDIASDSCANQFTSGQIEVMRNTVEDYKPSLLLNHPLTCVSKGNFSVGSASAYSICKSECSFLNTPNGATAPSNGWCFTDKDETKYGECCCLENGCVPDVVDTKSCASQSVLSTLTESECEARINQGCFNLKWLGESQCLGSRPSDGGCQSLSTNGLYCKYSCESACLNEAGCIWNAKNKRCSEDKKLLNQKLQNSKKRVLARFSMDISDPCMNYYPNLTYCAYLGNKFQVVDIDNDPQFPRNVPYSLYRNAEIENDAAWIFKDSLQGARLITDEATYIFWEIRFAHDPVPDRFFRWVLEVESPESSEASEVIRWFAYEMIDGERIRCRIGDFSDFDDLFSKPYRSFVEQALASNPFMVFSDIPSNVTDLSELFEIPEEFSEATRSGFQTVSVPTSSVIASLSAAKITNTSYARFGFGFAIVENSSIPLFSSISYETKFDSARNSELFQSDPFTIGSGCLDWWNVKDSNSDTENELIPRGELEDIRSAPTLNLNGFLNLDTTLSNNSNSSVCADPDAIDPLTGCVCFSLTNELLQVERVEKSFVYSQLSSLYMLGAKFLRIYRNSPVSSFDTLSQELKKTLVEITEDMALIVESLPITEESLKAYLRLSIPTVSSLNLEQVVVLMNAAVRLQIKYQSIAFSFSVSNDELELFLKNQDSLDIHRWSFYQSNGTSTREHDLHRIDQFLAKMENIQAILGQLAIDSQFLVSLFRTVSGFQCRFPFILNGITKIEKALNIQAPVISVMKTFDKYKIILKGTRRLRELNEIEDLFHSTLERAMQTGRVLLQDVRDLISTLSLDSKVSEATTLALKDFKEFFSTIINALRVFTHANPILSLHAVLDSFPSKISSNGLDLLDSVESSLSKVQGDVTQMKQIFEPFLRDLILLLDLVETIGREILPAISDVSALIARQFKPIVSELVKLRTVTVPSVCTVRSAELLIPFPCFKLFSSNIPILAQIIKNGAFFPIRGIRQFETAFSDAINTIVESSNVEALDSLPSDASVDRFVSTVVRFIPLYKKSLLALPYPLIPSKANVFSLISSNAIQGKVSSLSSELLCSFTISGDDEVGLRNTVLLPWLPTSNLERASHFVGKVQNFPCTTSKIFNIVSLLKSSTTLGEVACNSKISATLFDCQKSSCKSWCQNSYQGQALIDACIDGCLGVQCTEKYPNPLNGRCSNRCGNICGTSNRLSGDCSISGTCCFGANANVIPSQRVCVDGANYLSYITTGNDVEYLLNSKRDCDVCKATKRPTVATKAPSDLSTGSPVPRTLRPTNTRSKDAPVERPTLRPTTSKPTKLPIPFDSADLEYCSSLPQNLCVPGSGCKFIANSDNLNLCTTIEKCANECGCKPANYCGFICPRMCQRFPDQCRWSEKRKVCFSI